MPLYFSQVLLPDQKYLLLSLFAQNQSPFPPGKLAACSLGFQPQHHRIIKPVSGDMVAKGSPFQYISVSVLRAETLYWLCHPELRQYILSMLAGDSHD